MSGKLPFHAIERKIKRMGQIRPLPSHSTYQRDIDNAGARGTSILVDVQMRYHVDLGVQVSMTVCASSCVLFMTENAS